MTGWRAKKPALLLISMGIFIRAKTKQQIEHTNSRSPGHKRDQKQGEIRQRIAWLGVPAPKRPSPCRDFGSLSGHEYIPVKGKWSRCDAPEEYTDHLERENGKRSWFMDSTQRKGVAVKMKRRVKAALEILTVTFPPWLSSWVAAEVKEGHDPRPKLAAIRNAWMQVVQSTLTGKRYLLGYAFHADTDDLHFDLTVSRQDGLGGRIGKPGLMMVGPWCTGVDRQLRSGAKINADKKDKLQRSVANFRHRYGPKMKPLDVSLARALDQAAEGVLGPELAPYRESYAKQVPTLEREHTAAQLSMLDRAKRKLEPHDVTTPPAPEINLPPL